MDLIAGSNEISITLNHETEIQEKLEVESAPIQIDPDTTSHEESMVQHEILNTPVASSHDLQQSLRVIPQVVADSSGRLHVAGARQGQTEVLLDGFEINDPATGAFNSRVNVDAVRKVTIETGGYGAQYAHAGAGILALDTQSGDDHVRFGITNFIPEVRFQEGTHFGNWYPRLTFSGPIKKGKFWFSEALTIQHSFCLVNELPRGQNTDSQWSGDNLLRLQANLSPRNILQGSFLFNHLSDPALGLGAFSPLSTTTNIKRGATSCPSRTKSGLGGLCSTWAWPWIRAMTIGIRRVPPRTSLRPRPHPGIIFRHCRSSRGGCRRLGTSTRVRSTGLARIRFPQDGMLMDSISHSRPRAAKSIFSARTGLFRSATFSGPARFPHSEYPNRRIRAGSLAAPEAHCVFRGRAHGLGPLDPQAHC